MHILRAADRTATPWKNGGGVTREVAAWPPGADMGSFDWRVSLADVAADGPFSTFPSVDRVLTVIKGQGLELSVGGAVTRLEGGAPFAFPGEATVTARLTAGPIRDLNVMVRRGAWRAQVARWSGGPVKATAGPVLIVMLQNTQDFATLDVIFIDTGETAKLDSLHDYRALAVKLSRITDTFG